MPKTPENKYENVAQLAFMFHAKTCACRCLHCKGTDLPEPEPVSYDAVLASMRGILDWYAALDPKPFKLLLGAQEVPDFEGSERLMAYHTKNYGKFFLVCNGMEFMAPPELDAFVGGMRSAGARICMTSFYGTRDFHDRFARRAGDFDYLLRINAAAEKYGLEKNHVLFLSPATLPYLDALTELLLARPGRKQLQYRPVFNRRGRLVDDSFRLTRAQLEAVREKFEPASFWELKTLPEWRDYLLSDRYLDTTHDYSCLSPQVTLDAAALAEIAAAPDPEHYVDRLIRRHIRLRRDTPDMRRLCELYCRGGDGELLYTFADLECEWKLRYSREHRKKELFYF